MGSAHSTWLDARSAGVLAHVSSLPGGFGIGNLGPGARRLVDFLGRAGVRYWQICPVGPTGYGDSPYQTFSGRAGTLSNTPCAPWSFSHRAAPMTLLGMT